MLALTGGTVVDAEGEREADVSIENGEIVRVGNLGDEEPAETVDVTGRYVCPGLIDAHVHLAMDAGPDPAARVDDAVAAHAYRVTDHLRDALAAGVTTVRDLGSPATLAIEAARAVDAGVIEGPRVVPAGRNVTMTGGHGHWFGREADGTAEVRKAAREQVKAGADVLKCMATGGVLTEGAVVGSPELTPAELAALVDVADAAGIPTAAHAHGTRGIVNAARAGITSVEHGTFMDREAARLLAEEGTYWVPTASALRGIVDNGTDAGIPAFAVEKAGEAADAFDDAFEHALDADVTVAMGTDAGTPFNEHGEIPRELEYMVDYGMEPTAVLEAATVNAAQLLGLDDVGLVRRGYLADLVVLPADPRTDVTAWQDPETVIAGGERVRGGD